MFPFTGQYKKWRARINISTAKDNKPIAKRLRLLLTDKKHISLVTSISSVNIDNSKLVDNNWFDRYIDISLMYWMRTKVDEKPCYRISAKTNSIKSELNVSRSERNRSIVMWHKLRFFIDSAFNETTSKFRCAASKQHTLCWTKTNAHTHTFHCLKQEFLQLNLSITMAMTSYFRLTEWLVEFFLSLFLRAWLSSTHNRQHYTAHKWPQQCEFSRVSPPQQLLENHVLRFLNLTDVHVRTVWAWHNFWLFSQHLCWPTDRPTDCMLVYNNEIEQ